MKKQELTLTVSERVYLLSFLNDFKGKLSDLSIVQEDLKAIRITDGEMKDIGWTEHKNKEGQVERVTWDEEKVKDKVIALEVFTIQWVIDTIKAKDSKAEFTLADKPVLELLNKLEAK